MTARPTPRVLPVDAVLLAALEQEEQAQARLLAIPEAAAAFGVKVRGMLDIPARQGAALAAIGDHPEAAEIRRLVVAAAHGRWRAAHQYRDLARGAAARWCKGRPDLDHDEVSAAATEGLYQAAVRWRPGSGATFATYGRWWLRARLYREFPEVQGMRIPGHLAERLRYARRLTDQGLSDAEICQRLDLSPELLTAGRVAQQQSLSLDHLPIDDGDEGHLHAVVASTGPTPEELAEEAQRVEQLRAALARLPDREREIIEARFGLTGEELTLAEVGKRRGKSRERMRQIERRALLALRDLLANPTPVPVPVPVPVEEVPVVESVRVADLVRVVTEEPGIRQREAAKKLGTSDGGVYSLVQRNPHLVRKRVVGGQARLYLAPPEERAQDPNPRAVSPARQQLAAVLHRAPGRRLTVSEAAEAMSYSQDWIRVTAKTYPEFEWRPGTGGWRGVVTLRGPVTEAADLPTPSSASPGVVVPTSGVGLSDASQAFAAACLLPVSGAEDRAQVAALGAVPPGLVPSGPYVDRVRELAAARREIERLEREAKDDDRTIASGATAFAALHHNGEIVARVRELAKRVGPCQDDEVMRIEESLIRLLGRACPGAAWAGREAAEAAITQALDLQGAAVGELARARTLLAEARADLKAADAQVVAAHRACDEAGVGDGDLDWRVEKLAAQFKDLKAQVERLEREAEDDDRTIASGVEAFDEIHRLLDGLDVPEDDITARVLRVCRELVGAREQRDTDVQPAPSARPSHYGMEPEPLTVIVAWKLDFIGGSILKYVARLGRKDGATRLDDLRKIRDFADRAIGFEVTP